MANMAKDSNRIVCYRATLYRFNSKILGGIMQTNREYLLENPEVMVNAMMESGGVSNALGICEWRNKQKIRCKGTWCSNCRAEWLEAEHIEPDSLEKIKDDATTKSDKEYLAMKYMLARMK